MNESIAHTHIFLTGFMGSGKSKLGPRLAKLAGYGFADLDACIEEAEGDSIPTIFAEVGERGFREAERRQLAAMLAKTTPMVLSLGGGTFLSEDNRRLLQDTGTSVWLDVPTGILASRLGRRDHRPLLHDVNGNMMQGRELRFRVEELYQARKATYELADIRFEVRTEATPSVNARLLHTMLVERGVVAP